MSELAKLRRSKGFSQRALANEAGVSPSSVYEIEVGRRKPNPSTLRKIADALGVEVIDLLEEEERPKVSAPPSSREWALVASDKEFDSWVQEAKAGELHKLWNSLSDYAKGIENAERRAYVRDRAQKAIDQFFRLLPVKEIIAWKSSISEENEGREAG